MRFGPLDGFAMSAAVRGGAVFNSALTVAEKSEGSFRVVSLSR
jgi:hypothetical protein